MNIKGWPKHHAVIYNSGQDSYEIERRKARNEAIDECAKAVEGQDNHTEELWAALIKTTKAAEEFHNRLVKENRERKVESSRPSSITDQEMAADFNKEIMEATTGGKIAMDREDAERHAEAIWEQCATTGAIADYLQSKFTPGPKPGYAFPQYDLSVFLRTQPFLSHLQADLLAERICMKFAPGPVAKCCDTGNFDDGHICQKQPGKDSASKALHPDTTDWNKGAELAADYQQGAVSGGLMLLDQKAVSALIKDYFGYKDVETPAWNLRYGCELSEAICAKFGRTDRVPTVDTLEQIMSTSGINGDIPEGARRIHKLLTKGEAGT